jgi:hypothetical protein
LIDILIEDVFNSNRSPRESVEYLNYVAKQIIKNGRATGYELKRCLHDACIEKQICPKCGGKIHTETHIEYQGECRGVPAPEEWNEWVCEACGWKDDEEE